MKSIFKLCCATGLLLGLFSCKNTSQSNLPIYGEREAVEKTVDGKQVIDTVYHTIPAFKFLNQDSVMISEKDFEGKYISQTSFYTLSKHLPNNEP
ncbi:hypothetical protein [Sphingobacterium sp. E70]|uniref:hypothetical protein n=1 Tax=Sphingobacterium sp. E70 TaxID=2853439 RepID=UPI00279579AA|nr:hypothetical protein [Sphingobacterium sp. E70]